MVDFISNIGLNTAGVLLFAMIDHARPRMVVACGVCGMVTFICGEVFTELYGSGFLMYFLAATVTCVLAETGARIFRTPATVILLPAVIPLVPGSLLYRTVLSLIFGEGDSALRYGSEAISATAGIGVAIALVSAVYRWVGGVFHEKNTPTATDGSDGKTV